MKRKYRIVLILALLFVIISAVLLCFTAETREYKFSDLMSLRTQADDFQTGGSIRTKDLKKYRIVYDDRFTEEEIALVYKLGNVISENTGVSLKICNTTEGKSENTYTVAKHEILLGSTYRTESIYLEDQTWEGAASCTVIGKKLVLAIGEQADTIQILNRFIDLIENNCKNDTEFLFRDSDAFIDIGTAPVRSLYLNDLPITDYTIVNPAEKDSSCYEESVFLAETFRQRLGDICGYLLPLQNIEDGQPETAGTLYVGIQPTFDSLFNDLADPTAETAFWDLSAEGTTVYATGTASNCTASAMDALITKLTPPAPTEHFAVQIGKEDSVHMDTDISLLRIDMMQQWPAIDLLQKYVYQDFPDLFVLENASDSMGNTFADAFNGYYTCKSIGIFSNVYFCSSRFRMLDEGEIRNPENAGLDNTLHGYYVVLEDLMTGEEIVVFASDVTENTLGEFEKSVQYLCFPDRNMICLGNKVPEEAEALFTDTASRDEDGTLDTMINGGLEITDFEDRTEEIIAQQKDHAVIWYDRCDAHMLRLQYVN